MIALGAHPKVIQERLGHSGIKVTLDVYGHLFPNLDEALAQALDELAPQSAASSPPKPANVLAVCPPSIVAKTEVNLQVVYVEVRGFEPLTPAVRRQCSTGLSYTPGTAPG
jgi:hypothetical protein